MVKKLNRIVQLIVCVGLITAFVGCTATRKQQSTGELVDDSVITTKVKAELFNDAALKSFQIEVETFKGRVQLSGFVDSAQTAKRAGEVARRVKGVETVKNDLIVK